MTTADVYRWGASSRWQVRSVIQHDNPVGTCDRCGRATWDVDAIGATDEMTQPDGHPCGGVFVR